MPFEKHPLSQLAQFLPDNSWSQVVEHLTKNKVHLKVTKARNSILGNYKHKLASGNHTITINGNLNKYEFLITLIHELAHLYAIEKFGWKIESHGREWKTEYSNLLQTFMGKNHFPNEIEDALSFTIQNPSATTAGETALIRVLKNYDVNVNEQAFTFVENIPLHGKFKTKDGKIFIRGEKRRKRYLITEVESKKQYIISPIAQVIYIN